MSLNQIADATNLPDKTIDRIFAGKTADPYVSTLHRIVTSLGSSLDELFADTKVVVGNEKLATLQKTVEITNAELDMVKAERTILSEKVAALTAEVDLLRMQLAHKEELLAVHNYYIKKQSE